jgi:hypothetical protein
VLSRTAPTFINEKSERDLQPVYGEFGVDKHLRTIANLFEVEGITPTVLNLTVNTEIASNLFRSFFPESVKEFEDYLMKLSKDPSSKLCVDKETGQLYWWSSSLVRKTTHPFVQDITKPTFMERYDRVLAAKLQNVKEIAEERLRAKSFYALNKMY